MDREVRKLHHNKQDVSVIKVGIPSNDELVEGVTQLRYINGSGLFWYLKYNNTIYRQQFAGPNQQQVITTSIDSDGSPSGSDHGDLNGLTDDDHTQYLLVSGTRAMSGPLNLAGGEGALSFTAEDSSIQLLDNQSQSLIIQEDSNAYLTFVTTNSGEKITLGKKLEAGSVVIEGSAFNIDGGSIDGTTIGASSHTTIKGTTIDATTDFTIGSTVITDDSIVMTPSASDTITIAGATNGALSITTVDDAAAAANIQITADGTFKVAATTITLDSSGDVVVDAAGNEIYFKKNGSTTHTFNTDTGSIAMVNNGVIDNSVDGRLFLKFFYNGVHIGDTTQFNTAGGMGHGDERLTYDHFVLRWDTEHTGSYIGQHIAGGESDYKNNYAMIGFSTEPGRYANHTTSFSMTT